MTEKDKSKFGTFMAKAQKGIASIDVDDLKEKAKAATDTLVDRANEVKEDITEKLTELDRMLKDSIAEYNDAFTGMNDKGVQLYMERTRALDSIAFVETVINSIVGRPQKYNCELDEIRENCKKFKDGCDFAEHALKEARSAAAGAGASAAFMAPTAVTWITTTFGTASTGEAISILSGASETNAAMAWLGGEETAGEALLALAGPIGWNIAGGTLLSSIVIFTAKITKLNKQKNEEIQAIKQNIELVREMDGKIGQILDNTVSIRNGLNDMLKMSLPMYGADYLSLGDDQKQRLGALINNTKALAALFGKTIGEENGTEA